MRMTFRTCLGLGVLGLTIGCSSADRDRSRTPEDIVKNDGVASGVLESEHLTQGMTGLWWSKAEDFFIAGLHKSQAPEPPQVGVYFGSISDASKRNVHWLAGNAPAGEDVIGVRVYKDENAKNRVYFLTQLQNAGFYYPAFYYFNLDTFLTTSIHSRINCEQIDDLEINNSGLDIRCRVPAFESDDDGAVAYLDKKIGTKAKQKEADDGSDLTEISLDVDPSVTTLTKISDEQSRDWLNGVLRSCVKINAQVKQLCYPQ